MLFLNNTKILESACILCQFFPNKNEVIFNLMHKRLFLIMTILMLDWIIFSNILHLLNHVGHRNSKTI